jgi:uncharacterized protein
MLVRFAVQNYLSFNERTEFNMLTGSPRRLPHHVYHRNDLELLKMAAVYGANGAGKSNFVEALTTFRNIVAANSEFYLLMITSKKKFKLNKANSHLPIIFECEFVNEGSMFLYTVEIETNFIKKERLLLTKKTGGEEMIFERLTEAGKTKINFNTLYNRNEQDSLRIKLYEEEILKDHELLLSKLNESKEGFDIVKLAHSWFLSIKSIKPDFTISNLIFTNPKIFDFIKDYIKKFNTGISDFEISEYTFEQFFGEDYKNIEDILKAKLVNNPYVDISVLYGKTNPKSKTIALIENNQYKIKSLVTLHDNKEYEKIPFEPNEESDGSIRLWDILVAIYHALYEDSVIIIDEIERSIHPNLIKELITKFSENKETKGQLIFTTHESNLLDQEIFRQDEIWFAEKNTEGATEMYPMSDFDVRYDLDVRKGYLNGRFGAIPFLSDFKNLNWKAHVE